MQDFNIANITQQAFEAYMQAFINGKDFKQELDVCIAEGSTKTTEASPRLQSLRFAVASIERDLKNGFYNGERERQKKVNQMQSLLIDLAIVEFMPS